MDKKIILGKNTGDASGRSIDLSYRDVATLHHSFIGLMERMWKALKNRDKVPFKYMDLPEIDLTNFKMEMREMETRIDNNGDITVVRFYVKNVFDDSNRKWFAFRDMTLRTFLPYDGDVKTGRYDFDSMWGWFRKMKVQNPQKYTQLYDEAQSLTWYLDGCVNKFLCNNIHTD